MGKANRNPVDLIGHKFGRWTVLDVADDRISPSGEAQKMLLCKCECGTVKSVNMKNLMRGLTKSCGCLALEKSIERSTKHGKSNTRLFLTWENMRRRCYDKNNKSYYRYGGRGIKVCDEWNENFSVFYEWAMESGYQDNLTIDRIDNNKDYDPSNCRWADVKTQCRNRSSNVRITINGVTKIMSEWCEEIGIDRDLVSSRMKSGWDADKALFTPVIKPYRVVRISKDGSEQEYSSIGEASKQNGLGTAAIRAVCIGRNKTCGGYKWRYVKRNESA